MKKEWEDYSIDFYKCPECGYLLNKDCPCCQTEIILPTAKSVPYANILFDKEELNQIVEERIIEPIKRKELTISFDWVLVGESLPEEKINPYTKDFEYVLCSTIWEDVRPYKYGKPIGHNKAHFWHGGEIMDEYIIAWQPLPEPYKKGGAE